MYYLLLIPLILIAGLVWFVSKPGRSAISLSTGSTTNRMIPGVEQAIELVTREWLKLYPGHQRDLRQFLRKLDITWTDKPEEIHGKRCLAWMLSNYRISVVQKETIEATVFVDILFKALHHHLVDAPYRTVFYDKKILRIKNELKSYKKLGRDRGLGSK